MKCARDARHLCAQQGGVREVREHVARVHELHESSDGEYTLRAGVCGVCPHEAASQYSTRVRGAVSVYYLCTPERSHQRRSGNMHPGGGRATRSAILYRTDPMAPHAARATAVVTRSLYAGFAVCTRNAHHREKKYLNPFRTRTQHGAWSRRRGGPGTYRFSKCVT